jgi:uncharacterized membrane protein YidH (DUF202 family)
LQKQVAYKLKRGQMSRGTGTGLITLGIVLVVIGAILKYAVTVSTNGFNINTVGVILLVVGICSVVIGAVMFAVGANRRSTTRESVQNTPSGSEHVVERHDVMP